MWILFLWKVLCVRKVSEVYLIGAHTHKRTRSYKRITFQSLSKHSGIKLLKSRHIHLVDVF